MEERTATVGSRVGLHARPASLFVQAAGRQKARVTIGKPGGEPVNARSILSVLALDVHSGEEVVLYADGEGAAAALDELVAVLEADHDEPAAAGG
jgi:phosphocarrier protein HPr